MTVAIVLVAVMLIVASFISLVSCITIAIVAAAIGGNHATRGDEQKSGNGAVSGKALERTHISLQWVGGN
jgi:hypothetical protein